MKKYIRQIVLPLIAAMIWGSAFVFQRQAATVDMPPFTYNAARSVVAVVALLSVIFTTRLFSKNKKPKKTKLQKKQLIIGGLSCGIFLTVASNLQQAGLEFTTAGKAGFLTALYIIIVPLISIFFKKRVPFSVWVSTVIALGGLYCLSITESFSITLGDTFVILCAFAFAGQIMCIDRFSEHVSGLELSCAQFLVCAVISGAVALFTETISIDVIVYCLPSILYVGIFSSAVAYTLQIIAQKGTNPTVVSLMLSLEALFSVISGAIFLHERLATREYVGCLLMLVAVILAQLPSRHKKIE